MNSRLLHAAARGARIQNITCGGTWFSTNVFIQGQDERIVQYRIHPSDAHLAYGPISTALREFASMPNPMHHGHVHSWLVEFREDEEYLANLESDERSIFYLFVAEALADQGL